MSTQLVFQSRNDLSHRLGVLEVEDQRLRSRPLLRHGLSEMLSSLFDAVRRPCLSRISKINSFAISVLLGLQVEAQRGRVGNLMGRAIVATHDLC